MRTIASIQRSLRVSASARKLTTGGHMRIYLSSTYDDLRTHRRVVAQALRQLGHDVVGMEDYVAESRRSVKKCCEDVAGSSMYVLIVAWRYGYVPTDSIENPDQVSITEMEYNTAQERGLPTLVFLVNPEAPWPYRATDAYSGENGRGLRVEEFRSKLASTSLVSFFETEGDLARLAATSVSLDARTKTLQEMQMSHVVWKADEREPFMTGDDDSSFVVVRGVILDMASTGRPVLIVDLGAGRTWWSTRLYLLCRLVAVQTEIEEVLFLAADGRPVGLATPRSVHEGIVSSHPILGEWEASNQERQVLDDMDAALESFRQFFRSRSDSEESVKQWVRPNSLKLWLGHNLIPGSIRIDNVQQLTLPDIQQILGWPSEHVVVENLPNKGDVSVIPKAALAMDLAQEWVRREMPRASLL